MFYKDSSRHKYYESQRGIYFSFDGKDFKDTFLKEHSHTTNNLLFARPFQVNHNFKVFDSDIDIDGSNNDNYNGNATMNGAHFSQNLNITGYIF